MMRLCELAEIEIPEDIDGISYLPELTGRAKDQEKHEYLFWKGAVRVGNWKLHRTGRDAYKLFDLKKDPAEQNDLAASNPEVVARCREYFAIATKKGKGKK